MADDLLATTASNDRFEAALAELLLAEERGEQPDWPRVRQTWPELEAPLREFFHDRDHFARLAPRLAPTPDLAGAPAGPPDLPPGSRFGGYEIRGVLGRGGMGVVYHARQLSPEREVALKVIRTDRLAELPPGEAAPWMEMFRREAQLVASLEQHPNLVTLYEVGEHEGRPFFTMQLVRGGSLAETMRGGRWVAGDKKSAAQAARLLAAVARAVHHAHRSGVLHRDLKPGNILLDGEGRPLVSDFGLARRLDQSGSLVAGAIEGTAAYMAPEQAAGAKGALTTAADVYSLGTILYELLTGRPPFQGRNDLETLLLAVKGEAVPPRRSNPRLSRDLDVICLKCLEKEPGARYASAAALADDLENALADRPIAARPVGAAGRVWRWCRRNPFIAGAAAVTALTFVVAFILVSVSLYRTAALAKANGNLAYTNGELAQTNFVLAQDKQKEADRATNEANNAKQQSRNAKREATLLAYQQASALCESGKIDQGMLAFAHGLSLAEEAEAPDLEWLFRMNLTAWRRRLNTLRAILPQKAGVSAVACSPDGRTIATACWDHTTRLWDAATGKPLGEPVKHDGWVTSLAFSPDGKSLLTLGGFAVEVWDVASAKRLAVLNHGTTQVGGAVFSADGRTVLTGAYDQKVRFWDIASQKVIGEPLAINDWIVAVAFSSDGRLFAAAGKRGSVQVWDGATRQPLASFQHAGGVSALAVSPDGAVLATGGPDGAARLWGSETGQALGKPMQHPQEVTSVAFSPDGSLMLTGCLDRAARLWDMTAREVVGQPLAHPGEVLAVAFGADGGTLITGQGRAAGDARVWNLAPGGLAGGPMVHGASVLAVGFSPDSRRLATAGRDNAARLWDAATAEPVGDALPHNAEVNAVAFSPDSQTLVTGGDDEGRFWRAADGAPVLHEATAITKITGKKQVLQASVGGAERSGFGLGSRLLKEPAKKADAQPVWGPARGKRGPRNNGAAVFALAFSPDGTRVAAGGAAGATLYAFRNGEVIASTQLAVKHDLPEGMAGLPDNVRQKMKDEPPVVWRQDVHPANALAFSTDGRLVATAGEDGLIQVWDITTFDAQEFEARMRGVTDVQEFFRLSKEYLNAKPVGDPLRLDGEVAALVFSPDSQRLLAGGADSAARLWDLSTGQVIMLRHQGPVAALGFSPDGKKCVTASWDGTARLWDAATGEQIGRPLEHQDKVLAVAFSADGALVVTGGEDHTARLWDAATGEPVGPPLRQGRPIRAVAFRPDGAAVVTAGDDGTARLWAAPAAMKGDADRVRLAAEAWTGQTRETDGGVRFLEAAAWPDRRKALADLESVDPTADALARCRRQAREAEATGRWYAARWNLGRLVAAEPNNASYHLRRGAAAQELHDLAAAGADYDAAVQLAPDDWQARYRRGQLAILSRKWQLGIDDLSDALQRLPRTDDRFDVGPDGRQVSIHFGRGYARAAMRQWKDAATDFEITQNPFAEPAPAQVWIDHALVLLELGDAKRYGALCQGMLAKFANPQDEPKSTIVTMEYGRQVVFNYGRPVNALETAMMVWTCCLSPDAPPDRKRPLELARKLAQAAPGDYPCARAFGAALYRADKGEEAVRQLEAAAALQKASPSTWLFLAMAHQKCGRGDKAKEWLDKARAWIEQAHKPKPEGVADKGDPSWDGLPWTEQAALELLQGEAEKLIEKDSAKP